MRRGKWFVQDPRTCKWDDVDEQTNQMMEAAFQSCTPQVAVLIQGQQCRVDFRKQRLYSLRTGGSRLIKREEVASSNPYEIDPVANSQMKMKEIEALFAAHHKNSDCDEACIQGEGLLSLSDDLGISIEDESLLLLACNVQATEPFKLGRHEFIDGLRSLGIDSVKKLKAAFGPWKAALQDKRHFKYFYWFAFDWTREPNARVMQNEAAVDSWKSLLASRAGDFPLDLWCDFVTNVHKKAISKDVWKSLLDFMHTVQPDMSDYNEEEGWPVLMDEFVDWVKPKLGGN